jgi:hypothetical protein
MRPIPSLVVTSIIVLSFVGCGPTDLEGTWKSACYMGTETTLSYSGIRLTGTFAEFSDMSCTTPRHIARWTGVAVPGAKVSKDITKLDLAFDSFRSTALTQAEADFVNKNAYCGISDWKPNEERDILGLDCYGFSIPKGGKSFDIYQTDGKSLRFGKDSKILTKPTEADRPTQIDEYRVLNKQ